ncbi:MAG: hypothetical protein WCW14_01705 [Candidatus Paceibacterota bacterium]|jgi:hypothetical protein
MKKWPPDNFSRFPKDFQSEILDEVPNFDEDYYKYIESWVLESEVPVFLLNKDILKDNLGTFERIPQDVLDIVNEKWGTSMKTKKVLDKRADRYLEYAKMNADTAKPSTMINGEIVWGTARFVASLVRGDEGIYVWKIKAD